jgi:hypothetical protein
LIEELDEIRGGSRAVDRRLFRQSIKVLSTDGPVKEVTFRAPFCRTYKYLSGKEVIHNDLPGPDLVKLYDAISFGMWEFGPSAIMNGHITIGWGSYRIRP